MESVPGSLVQEFSDEITCPICLDCFTDPVFTDCGHNFCRACITKCKKKPNRSVSCPECREPLWPCNMKCNRKLASIVEIRKKLSDFNVQQAKDAEGAKGVCKMHQEPLQLFCKEDEALICAECDRSEEHREHCRVPVAQAAEEYKDQIRRNLPTLKKERQKLMELKVVQEQRYKGNLNLIAKQKHDIRLIFEELFESFESKEQFLLAQQADLEKQIKKRQKKNMTKLSQEISSFNDLIEDVEMDRQQPPSEFLQDIRANLSRCQEGKVIQQLELSPGLEWKLRNCYLKSGILEVLEGSLTQGPTKVNVTLDHDTAHPQLFVYEDLKTVSYKTCNQDLPNNSKRFDCVSCVLGTERFTSGNHCWEVAAQKPTEAWAVGVAQDSLLRKGMFRICPERGIWAVGKISSEDNQLVAFTSCWKAPIALSHEPRKIRVTLDYDEGCVEFFDADSDNFIFAFPPASFSGEAIRPFFQVDRGSLQC